MRRQRRATGRGAAVRQGAGVRGRNWGIVNSTQLPPLTQKAPLKIDDLLKSKLPQVCSRGKVPCPRPCGLQRYATGRTRHGGAPGGPAGSTDRDGTGQRRKPQHTGSGQPATLVSQTATGTPRRPKSVHLFTRSEGAAQRLDTRDLERGRPREGRQQGAGPWLPSPRGLRAPEPQPGSQTRVVSDTQQLCFQSFFVSLKVPFPGGPLGGSVG